MRTASRLVVVGGLSVSFLGLASACGSASEDAPSSEPWMAPRPAGGKADGIAVLLGADIPSQHVDPTREYLFDRKIDLLRDVAKKEFHYRATSQLSAVLAVSEPGVIEESVNVDSLQLVRRTETRIDENRAYRVHPYHWPKFRLAVSLQVRRDVSTSAALSNSEALLLVIKDAGVGKVYRKWGYAASYDTPPGTYLMELWEHGTRKLSRWVHFPNPGKGSEALDLSDYAHHGMHTLDGTPLVRNVVKTSHAGDCSHFCEASVTFSHDLADKPLPANVNAEALKTVETPTVGLPFGRYSIPTTEFGVVFVDLFSEGAIRLTLPNESGWAHIEYHDRSDGKTFFFLNGAVQFRPNTSKLYLEGLGGEMVTLSKDQRTG